MNIHTGTWGGRGRGLACHSCNAPNPHPAQTLTPNPNPNPPYHHLNQAGSAGCWGWNSRSSPLAYHHHRNQVADVLRKHGLSGADPDPPPDDGVVDESQRGPEPRPDRDLQRFLRELEMLKEMEVQ